MSVSMAWGLKPNSCWCSRTGTNELDVVVQGCNHSGREAGVGESGLQGPSHLPREFQTGLGYTARPCLPKQKIQYTLIFGSVSYAMVWVLWGPHMVTHWNPQIYMLVERSWPWSEAPMEVGPWWLHEYTNKSSYVLRPTLTCMLCLSRDDPLDVLHVKK